MSVDPQLSAVIVAGGQSRRLGQDKRRLRLWGADGPTLLERTVALVTPLCSEVLVVLNDPQHWPELAATCIPDAYPQAGALGGLLSGLQAARGPWVLALAADLPLLSAELLQGLLALPRSADLLLPVRESGTRNRRGAEPLCALYHRRCIPAFAAALARGDLRLIAPLEQLQVDEVPLTRLDPEGKTLYNLNTPDDLRVFEKD